MDMTTDRWWERFWKYKCKSNNEHDWFMVWADSKLSKDKSIFTKMYHTQS